MLKIIILDYSILGQHSRESALFSKKFATQLTLWVMLGPLVSWAFVICVVEC